MINDTTTEESYLRKLLERIDSAVLTDDFDPYPVSASEDELFVGVVGVQVKKTSFVRHCEIIEYNKLFDQYENSYDGGERREMFVRMTDLTEEIDLLELLILEEAVMQFPTLRRRDAEYGFALRKGWRLFLVPFDSENAMNVAAFENVITNKIHTLN